MSARDDFLNQYGSSRQNQSTTRKRKKTTEEELLEQLRGQGYTLTSSADDDIAPDRSYASRGINVTTESVRSKIDEDDEIAPTGSTDDGSGLQFFKQSELFEDGWQAGDVAKAILGSVGDLGLSVVKGFTGFAEGIADSIVYGIADLVEKEGDTKSEIRADALREGAQQNIWADKILGGAQEAVDKSSVLGRTTQAIGQGVGQIIPTVAVGALTGGIGAAAGLSTAATGALTTGAVSALSGTSSYGANKSQALQEGASEEEAAKYGLIAAAVDVGTEMLFGGMGKGVNALGFNKGLLGIDDLVAKGVTSRITNTVAKNAIQGTIKASGEGFEELLAGGLQAIAKWKTYASEKELSKLLEDENLLEQFVVGAFSAGISQGGDVRRSTNAGQDYVTGLTNNEQAVVDRVYEDEVAKRTESGEKLTGRQKSKIYDSVIRRMERGYIDTDTIESVLGGKSYETYKSTIDSENSLVEQEKSLTEEYEELNKKKWSEMTGEEQDRRDELKKLLPEIREKIKANEQSGNSGQLKSALSKEVREMVKGDRLVESYNEQARATQDYVPDYDKYKGTKHEDAARQTIENALKYKRVDPVTGKEIGLSNTNAVHDIVDMATGLSADTGYIYEFKGNEEIKADFIERQTKEIAKLEAIENRTEAQNNKIARLKELVANVQSGEVTVNGNIGENGQVVLNLDSEKLLSATVGHEVTHSVESAKHYAKLKDSLFAYAKSKGVDIDAEMEMKALEYEGVKDANPEAELVADLVGEYLFADSDYVKTLTTDNQNVAQWLFNEIKYLLTKVTAGSKEERELLRVKHEFEKAFREAAEVKTNNSGTVKNSISKNKITNKLTGEEIDQNSYRVLDRLNNGETVAGDELANLKEVQEGKLKLNEMVQDFIAQNPQHSEKPKNQIGTHLLRTEERKQLRRQIIEERLAEGSFSGIDKDGNEEYNGSVKNGKRLDIVIGLPASGKSSGIVNPLSQFYQSAVIDSDIIKTKLPEYNGGIGASLVHTESIDMNGTLLKKTMALGRNAVLPIIGANPDNVAMYIEKAKGQGYAVHVHLCELSGEKATGRLLLRYLNKGRFISPTAIARYGNSPAEVYEQLKQRGDISGYSRWDNDVPEGQRPNQTEISGNNRAYGQFSGDWRATRSRISEGVVAGAERVNNEIAPTKETSSKDGVFFDAEAEEISDSKVQYSLRKSDPPKETSVAYKVFFVKDGKLYPPMVANPDGADTPMGVWLDADVGTAAPPSKTGRQQVKAGGKGTQGGSGSLAFRPGWHLGDLPRASQFDRLNPETGKKELFPENFVWAEVEYAKDVDYPEEAMSYGYTENGKFRHAYAGLPRLPENGYYRYRTNPRPDTVPWVITGAMKVNRLLSDAEVNEILEQNGVPAVHRQGGDVGLDKFGFDESGTTTADDTVTRFSLSKPVEQTKDLVALHNLTADKLTKSLELGGLPMPSLAITKADIPHDNFGEITLVFGKETIDPKASKKNKVYSADAWTPIFPNVEYEADSTVVNRVSKKLRDLESMVDDYFHHDLSRVGYSIEDYLNRQGGEEGLIQYVMDNYGLKAAYLEDTGKHIEKVTRQEEVPRNFNPAAADKYEKIMDILGVSSAEEIWGVDLKEARDNHGEELEAVFPGITKSALRMGKVIGMVGSYIQGKDSAPEYRTVTDSAATKTAVDNALDAEGFEAWVRNLFSGVVKDSGIYNNKDIFTPSGNRRTFKQTHFPVTLENIVKAMASQNDGNAKNVSGFNGVKTLRAATAETFKSIDEMHQREGRLQHLTQEQADEITDALQTRLSNIIHDIDNENGQKGDRNPFIRYDQIGNVLTEIGEGGKYNVADIQSVFSEYGRPIGDDVALAVKQLLYDVSQMPVNIFEAKPQRVVGFDEAKVFVIPRNADVKLKQELLNRGYSIAEYDPDVEGDRQRVVNNFEEYKFSLSNAGENTNRYNAPTSDLPFTGKDLLVKPTEDIAPIADTNATENIAPETNVNYEAEDNGIEAQLYRAEQTLQGIKDEIAAIDQELQEGRFTDDEAREKYREINERYFSAADEYDRLLIEAKKAEDERFANLSDADAPPEMDAPYYGDESEVITPADPFAERDMKEVGSDRSINAYMYDNPEFKPYIQEAARGMLEDIRYGNKGKRWVEGYGTDRTAGGSKRVTTPDIAELLDDYGYTYDEIKAGLDAIIEDNGKGKNAVSKRIEIMLDKRLRNGYTDVEGNLEAANQDYINLLKEKRIDDSRREGFDSFMQEADNYAPPADDIAPLPTYTVDAPTMETAQQEVEKVLGNKDSFISKKAMDLYEEVKSMTKGVRVSGDLSYILDTLDLSEENKANSYRSLRTALLNIRDNPNQVVNPNSAIEANLREMIGREYDSMAEDLAMPDGFDSKKFEPGTVGEQQTFSGMDDMATKQPSTRKELHKSIIQRFKDAFAKRGFDFDLTLNKAKRMHNIAINDNTPQRVNDKTFGYEEGELLNDLTFNRVALTESERVKWVNAQIEKVRQLSKKYGIKPYSKEEAAAQMYAEGFYVNDNDDLIAYGKPELKKDFPKTWQNIVKLAEDPIFRQMYDEMLDLANEARTRNLYEAIPRRDNYFLHFREMDDTFSRIGIPFNPNDIKAMDLPTDINGRTADLKPGQPYFSSSMQRKGKRTSFGILTGLEKYINSISKQIYHIDSIQTERALWGYIAEQFGQAEGLENIDLMTPEQAADHIQKVYSGHLSNYARFLNEHANHLAGKTALMDRSVEGIIGRRGLQFLNTVNSQTSKNQVGFNVSSSLTNFIPTMESIARLPKQDSIKAFGQMLANIFHKDGFAESDPALIRRKGEDKFAKKKWEKVSDAGYVFMSTVDNIASEFIVRSKYNELTRKGMDSETAHIRAGEWAMRIMGDRSLGQMPLLYNSKTLGLITKYQLEVRNVLDSMFYDTIQESKMSAKDIEDATARNAKTAAKYASKFAQIAILNHLFGTAFEKLAGYNPAFDIIGLAMTLFGLDDDEEEKDTFGENFDQFIGELADDLPYISTFTGGGRIPVADALPIGELLTNTDDNGEPIADGDWGWLTGRLQTASEALPYYVLPGGYGQLKKTYQGLSMFDDDLPIAGSYTDSGNLRFPVEDTFGNRLQAGIFGQYASANAREYFDNDWAPLKEKQIQEFADLDIPIRDYREIREDLADLDTLGEKAVYISNLDLPIDKKNLLINNIADRDEPIDLTGMSEYDDFGEFEYAKEYPTKYAFLEANGISYDEFEAMDEDTNEAWNWAYKNPGKRVAAKVTGIDVPEFREYIKQINKFEADKDADGDPISGSAKNKKMAYIESLNVDRTTKIILHRMTFQSDDFYNLEIVEYIIGRNDLTFDEKTAFFEALGFKTSNGKVYWD